MQEARDGALAFHTRRLPPKLNFPQVPIMEIETQDLIKDKLQKLLC